MRPRPASLILILSACLAFVFAAFSTYDFVAHLDRQVHGIHCSFLPGLTQVSGDSAGCQVTLMSPYSSVLRSAIWGGVPIALPAMAVFAFLAFWGGFLVLTRRESDPRATLFSVAATGLPVLTSLVMGYLSLVELDAACKLCIGIYVCSAIGFGAALTLHRQARALPVGQTPGTPLSTSALGMAFALGVAFVAVPVTTYAIKAPDFSHYVGTCGELSAVADARVLISLGGEHAEQTDSLQMTEVLDPLCPSCKALEGRLVDLPAAREVARSAILFPLDNACNWMVDDAIHPGACAISEAIVCAGDNAGNVLDWAFAEREAIIEAAAKDPKAAARMAGERFPGLSRCIGSAGARAKVNLALRWAVDNRIQVLTPQVYVEGLRLCDEDTDLGLDYALPRLIARARSLGDRAPARRLKAAPAADSSVVAARKGQRRPPVRAAHTEVHEDSTTPTQPVVKPPAPAPDAPAETDKPAAAEQAQAAEHEAAEAQSHAPADDGAHNGLPPPAPDAPNSAPPPRAAPDSVPRPDPPAPDDGPTLEDAP